MNHRFFTWLNIDTPARFGLVTFWRSFVDVYRLNFQPNTCLSSCFVHRWETQGEWTTNQPLSLLKLRLMAEHSSKLHLSDDKELATVRMNLYGIIRNAVDLRFKVPLNSWRRWKMLMLSLVFMPATACFVLAWLLYVICIDHILYYQ